jgi:hypothetical protein
MFGKPNIPSHRSSNRESSSRKIYLATGINHVEYLTSISASSCLVYAFLGPGGLIQQAQRATQQPKATRHSHLLLQALPQVLWLLRELSLVRSLVQPDSTGRKERCCLCSAGYMWCLKLFRQLWL